MIRVANIFLVFSLPPVSCGETTPLTGPDASAPDAPTADDAAPGCPSVQPTLGDRCAVSDILDCEYGEECCCGRCGPSTIAQCTRGTWGFSATDFCLGANLCDVGPSDEGGVSVDAGGD